MKPFLLVVGLAFLGFFCAAQNVGIGTTTPESSAQLEVRSTDKGILFPRVTTPQRNAIVSPTPGLMVFDIQKNMPYYFNGIKWVALGPIAPNEVQPVEQPGISINPNEFGASVAMAGVYAAVGITGFDSAGITNCGGIRIYTKANGQWKPIQMIIAPDPVSGDEYGLKIDMQGDYMVVGAPYKTVSGIARAGKIYIYKLNTGTGLFVLDGQLTHPDGIQSNSLFGWSVSVTTTSSAVGGVAVAAGSPQFNVGGTRKGAVSVFRRAAVNSYPWMNTINGTQTGESFGNSIDMDGNLLVIGAPEYDSTANGNFYTSCGRVQVNRFSGTSYSTYDFTIRPFIDTGSYYGASVSISGSSIVFAGIYAGTNLDARPQGYQRIGVGIYNPMSGFPEYPGNQEAPDNGTYMGYQMAITPQLTLIGVPHTYRLAASSGDQPDERDYVALFKKNPFVAAYDYYGLLTPPGQVERNTNYGFAVAASGSDYIVSMTNATSSDGVNIGAVFFGTIEE